MVVQAVQAVADVVAAAVVVAAVARVFLEGLGVGYRPELAMHIERRSDLNFVEILADNHFLDLEPEPAILQLKKRGFDVVVHSIGLSLGGSKPPSRAYLEALQQVVDMYGAIMVSDHLAFVRSKGCESGHLLPVKRSEETLKVVIENLSMTCEYLKVPFALENIAAYLEWPGNTIEESEFLARVLEAVDCELLLDVSNLHANAFNLGLSRKAYLERLPLERVAYIHVAGGQLRKGLYHDTHAHALSKDVIETLDLARAAGAKPAVLLERDDHFPDEKSFGQELDLLRDFLRETTVKKGGGDLRGDSSKQEEVTFVVK